MTVRARKQAEGLENNCKMTDAGKQYFLAKWQIANVKWQIKGH